MAMKKGHGPEVVHYNVREMMRAGHPKMQAVAAAMASSRKYKKMSDGGLVGDDMDEGAGSDFDENASTTLGERNILGMTHPNSVESPEMQDAQKHLAKALFQKSEEEEMQGYAMGGLVQPEYSDEPLGAKPSENMESSSEEPMSSMPVKPDGLEHRIMGNPSGPGLSEEAKRALQEKKMKRRFVR